MWWPFGRKSNSTALATALEQAGFQDFSTTAIPYKEHLRWNLDWIMLEV
jgi:hypothetical protein